MQKILKITISVINYNDRKFIFRAIESAVNQNYPNLEIIITDNNSTDGTREEIGEKIAGWEKKRNDKFYPVLTGVCDEAGNDSCEKKELKNNHCQFSNRRQDGVELNSQESVESIKYIKNKENAGFGRPHNEAIRIMKGDFILLLNSDAILTSDYIENAIKPFQDKKIGAVQGKLLRYDFDKNELYKNKEDPELNIIDTTGLMMLKNRRIVCIGQGEADRGQFEKETEVFGADGAIPVYRKEALEDVKLRIMNYESRIMNKNVKSNKDNSSNDDTIHNSVYESETKKLQPTTYNLNYEYFDENFFMYKEDVDLAWRLRLYGWKTIYTPQAVAYHGRGSGDSMAKNYIDIIKERRKINKKAKFFSFKHQRLMQIKNDFPSLLFTKHLPQFIIKEVGAWMYMMIFERFTLRILKDLYRDIPLFLKKRKMVMARKRIGAKEMERWFE